MTGEVAPDLSFAWSGAPFMPGSTPFGAVNLSAKKELAFQARGDGKTYRVMLFSKSHGTVPAVKTFVTSGEWKAVRIPFAAFEGVDPHELTAIAFVAGPQPGTFNLQIDEVSLDCRKLGPSAARSRAARLIDPSAYAAPATRPGAR